MPLMLTVVVLNPAEPDPPKVWILGLCENEGILDRDTGLVIVPVQDLLLELELRQFPFVHELVEEVMVMISGASFACEPIDEGCF